MSDEQNGASDEPRTRAALLARIRAGRAALVELLDQLDEEELTTPGVETGWSVKDHLAHLAAWEAGIAALLRHEPRHAGMGFDEETYRSVEMDTLNDRIVQRSRGRSLAAVRAEFEQSHQRLVSAIEALEDADLFRPYSFYQPHEPGENRGDPILGWIVGNSYEHYEEHLPWIRAVVDSARGRDA